ncbi:MAG: rhomboid family intramembrane serine protease [Pseudomonadota bacterium]
MFPISDDNPQLATPVATWSIVALNLGCWALVQGLGFGEALRESICSFGLVPASIFGGPPRGEVVYCPNAVGALGLFTSMFMHGGWMHLLGNTWFLWVFGGNVEDSMGALRFVVLYLLSGLAASAAQIAADPTSPIPVVGASGAIGGVMGAYLVLFPRVRVRMLVVLIVIFTTFRVPAYLMLGYWIVVQIIGGLTPSEGGGIAFWAHIGGFFAGALLVMLLKDEELLLRHPHRGLSPPVDPANVWNDSRNREDQRR